jgi:hypothetical protein
MRRSDASLKKSKRDGRSAAEPHLADHHCRVANMVLEVTSATRSEFRPHDLDAEMAQVVRWFASERVPR